MTQIALVTGGSRGIGAATARRLAEDGHRVIILSRTPPGETSASLWISCDVTDKNSVENALHRIQQELGVPGILVNNAGFGGPLHRIDQVADEEWETVFATNVRAPFWFCRALLPQMKQQGFGRVINIGSIQSLRGSPLSSTYIASKHALAGYTKALACEWGRWGITCNVICPGYVNTGMLPPDFQESSGIKSHIPAGRLADPHEIADAVSFLAGPRSAYINGAELTIDGGLIVGYAAPSQELF